MRRKIDEKLDAWKDGARRKPLLLNGVRQVGKTHSLLAFGQRCYANCVHVDFAEHPEYRNVFAGSIDPVHVIPQLEALLATDISEGSTLLVLDEVQLCPRALTALKYFAEEAPAYHVAAAGSLLGVSIARGEQSFPVGKVDLLDMHPMDFEEFLWAAGEQRMAALIAQAAQDLQEFALHSAALDLYKTYLLVGGMPEAVATFCAGNSLASAQGLLGSLATSYIADMAKHAGTASSAKILAVWNAVPEQLAKENHKFQYATISSAARAYQYEAAIAWLVAAGMVVPCYRVGTPIHPLRSHMQQDYFKLYLADCGLFAHIRGIDQRVLSETDALVAQPKGALAESYVMQQLVASGLEPFYWGTASKAEVDFVVDVGGQVVPIEVKAGTQVRARSLSGYCQRYDPAHVARVSARNFGRVGNQISIPLYAAHCLRDVLEAQAPAGGGQQGQER